MSWTTERWGAGLGARMTQSGSRSPTRLGTPAASCRLIALFVVGTAGCAAPVDNHCAGVVRSAVIHGVVSPPDELPLTEGEMAAIGQVIARFESRSGSCTGALLNRHWMLTARHCVVSDGAAAQRIEVCFGRDRDGSCATVPQSAAAYWENGTDFALLRLETAAPAEAIPFGLPEEAPPLRPGTRVLAAGRGTREAGRSIGVGQLRFVTGQVLAVRDGLIDVAAVANVGEAAQGLCDGDSGGPLFARDSSGVPRIVGALWRGFNEGCVATESQPDQFTSIEPFRQQIETRVGDLRSPPAGCVPGTIPFCSTCDGSDPHCPAGNPTVVYCDGGELLADRCGFGEVCGWSEALGSAGCVLGPDPCGGIPPRGECEGATLRRCDAGRVTTQHCSDGCVTDRTGWRRCATPAPRVRCEGTES